MNAISLLAAIALAFVSATPSALAAVIAFDAVRHGDTIDIHASAVLNADARTAWRVLTDYNHYPEFIPDLHSSRVVARRDATVTVEQSGVALLWLFRMPIDIVFEIQEYPPVALRSRAVAGTLRALTSDYSLTPTATGVELQYTGRVTPGFSLFAPFEQAVVERNSGRQFQALADEIERQFAAAHQ